jgi:alanyl-tRNA synthetase
VVIEQMGDAYPELRAGRETIVQAVRAEEQRFDAVLTSGLPKLEDLLERAAQTGAPIPGDEAFRLYDTLGLPLDFIEDLASERKLELDRAGFDTAMEAQREKARAKSAFEGKRAQEPTFASSDDRERLRRAGEQFEGYTTTTVEAARITALFDEGRRQIASLAVGSAGYALLDRTPFYLEAGGQVSDVGDLRNAAGTVLARVTGVSRLGAGLPRAHHVSVVADTLEVGQVVTARVDVRPATRSGATTPRRTCCTRRCDRCSGLTSSRRARSSRPIGCASTSPTSRRCRRRSSRRSRGSSTSRFCAMPPLRPR